MMQSEINDEKTSSAICHDLDNNDKIDESGKTQPNKRNPNETTDSQPKEGNPNEPTKTQPKEGNPDEPAKTQPMEENPHKPANSLPNEGKPDEPGSSQPNEGTPGGLKGQCIEKTDSEKTMQNSDKIDQPERGLQVQNKEKPAGKQKKRKLILNKKKNVSNGNVEQNKNNPVKAKLGQQKKAKIAKPEGSTQERNLELVKMVDQNQIHKGETSVVEVTDQIIATNENNGDLSKGDKKKKRRLRGKKGKGITESKMENPKQQLGEASGSMNGNKVAGKFSLQDKGSRHDKTKDKLGGLIFMCSSKTKPDCFRYSVMGVSMNKKDLVSRIKPGLKLFLYDFDLKLLYGVYRATSTGGMKLEPAAFGGAFPVQVKFEVFKDCYPLPESVFQKAIKENYNEKRKFNTELTFEQVKKLTMLFQTVGVSSNAPTRGPRMKRDETKVLGGDREYRTHSSQARSNRDEYAYVDYRKEARKDESPHESFLSEREYRTYGLRGRRQSRSPPRLISSLVPRLDPERDIHARYPGSLYGDTTSAVRHDPLLVGRGDTLPYSLEGQRDITSSVHHESTMFDERRYLTHNPISQLDYQSHLQLPPRQTLGLDSNRHQYIRSSYGLPDDPYSSSIRRDELAGAGPYYSLDGRRVVFLPEADSSLRREPEAAAFDHSQGYIYQEAPRPGPVFAPVSSRYSFAGPSSYR